MRATANVSGRGPRPPPAGLAVVGCSSGGMVDTDASFLGRLAWDVQDLELQPVGVEEEHRVVAGEVEVLLRLALELGADAGEPFRPVVDGPARERLECEVVEPDAVAIVRTFRLRLRL